MESNRYLSTGSSVSNHYQFSAEPFVARLRLLLESSLGQMMLIAVMMMVMTTTTRTRIMESESGFSLVSLLT